MDSIRFIDHCHKCGWHEWDKHISEMSADTVTCPACTGVLDIELLDSEVRLVRPIKDAVTIAKRKVLEALKREDYAAMNRFAAAAKEIVLKDIEGEFIGDYFIADCFVNLAKKMLDNRSPCGMCQELLEKAGALESRLISMQATISERDATIKQMQRLIDKKKPPPSQAPLYNGEVGRAVSP